MRSVSRKKTKQFLKETLQMLLPDDPIYNHKNKENTSFEESEISLDEEL